MIRQLIKQQASLPLRRAARDLQMELHIFRQHRAGVKRAATFAGRPSLRLNLGSGFQAKTDWVNIDLGDRADLALDLRQPLPFADNSVTAIYSEHFMEHLDVALAGEPAVGDAAQSFLEECWRVLQPGALLEIIVPDAEGIIQEYVARRERPFPQHEWWGPKWCDTAMHCVNYVFRQGREHQYAYDNETLAHALERTGFSAVRRRPFDPAIDAANHEIGSLCMQARKPAPVVARSGRRTAPSWRPLSEALRRIRSEWRMHRRHRAAVAKSRRLARTEPLRLLFGSDGRTTDGWITVDPRDERADLQLDLRERLPFDDASVAQVRVGPGFERLSYPDLTESTAWQLEMPQTPSEALSLLRECRRVLIPGGRLELTVSDSESILNAYVVRRIAMPDVNDLFRHNRAYVYDAETLERILRSVGFVDVTRFAANAALDAGHRPDTLFVHARTPAAARAAAGTAA
jgi:predicted SAM-dependent methyltransferase